MFMADTQLDVPHVSAAEWIDQIDRYFHHGTVPVAVALSDLDGFGPINDRHGREAGDRVLMVWEKTLLANVPSDAVVVRIGGDEYAVALPGSSAENALILFEEIRGHFAGQSVPGVELPLGASAGIAAAPPHAATGEELHRAAGEALMRAKREGRGRVAIYVDEKMTLKSNYYSRANLDRLAKLSGATSRTEASLLREALDDLFEKYRDAM
jgi:diguanylate cyclase (GGDEF)-like protein